MIVLHFFDRKPLTQDIPLRHTRRRCVGQNLSPPDRLTESPRGSTHRMSTRILTVLLLVTALAYAPLAHGCVEDGKWFVLDGILVAAFLSHGLGLITKRQRPALPLPLLVPAGCLMVLAAFQALNPHYIYDPVTQGLRSLGNFRPGFPWTVDQHTTVVALTHWGALGLAFLTMTDLFRKRETRWLLLGAISVIGAAMSVFAIFCKMQGGIIVPFTKTPSETFFGTFVYHGHAAAFLNLCWPAALALVMLSQRGERPFIRILGVNAFLLIFLGLFVNTSKFGHLSALPSLAVALLLMRRAVPSNLQGLPLGVKLVLSGVVLATAVFLMVPILAPAIGRWNEVIQKGFGNRPVLFSVATGIIRQYPVWGTGPGTFSLVVPYFTVSLDATYRGKLTHAHQDYLQTMVEWGVIGFGLWLAIVAGGFLRGVRTCLRHPMELSTITSLVALAILGTHCLLDFPLQIGSLRLYAASHLALLWRDRSANRQKVADEESPLRA